MVNLAVKFCWEALNEANPWLLCSLIHKFGHREEADYDEYIEDIKRNLPANFKAKGDIYVFVDECTERNRASCIRQ